MNTVCFAEAVYEFNWVALLKKMFLAAVSAGQSERAVAQNLSVQPNGKTIVVGAGKASAEMARVFEAHWKGERDNLSGLVVTRYDYAVKCDCIESIEAAHPARKRAILRANRIL